MSTKSYPRVGTDSRSHCAMQLELCTNTDGEILQRCDTDRRSAGAASQRWQLGEGECVNLNASIPGYAFSLYNSCGSSKWRRVLCEQELNNSGFVSVRVEEIRVFQACTCGWRCDTKCRALAHTRKCAFLLCLCSVSGVLGNSVALSIEVGLRRSRRVLILQQF